MPGTVFLKGTEPATLLPEAFQDTWGKAFGGPHTLQSPFREAYKVLAVLEAISKTKKGD
jgi:hypothetical protein